jgi:hypothetical protein
MKSSFFLFGSALLFIAITILLNSISHHLYWYWQSGWIDSVAHFFGGLGTTLLFLWFYFYSGLITPAAKVKIIFFSSLFYVLIVGALWEIFEYKFGLVVNSPGYLSDTFSDLIMDLIGGAVAFLMVRYMVIRWRN